MSDEKIRPVLTGSAETMLQSFYARAMHSKNPKNKFKDSKAEEIVEKLDYDFNKAASDSAMSGGVVARTVVFDELVKKFIDKNPMCTVVNIACGLDTKQLNYVILSIMSPEEFRPSVVLHLILPGQIR